MRSDRGVRASLAAAVVVAAMVARPDAQRQGTPPVQTQRPQTVAATTGGAGAEGLELAIDRMMADREYPPIKVSVPTKSADETLLDLGLVQPYPNIRAAAVRGLGRFENPANVARIIPFLQDSDANVRLEAANALALSLRRAQAAEALPAMQALLARIPVAVPAEASVYDALGRLPYSQPDGDRMEKLFVDAAQIYGIDTDAALVNLFTRDRRRPISAATRAFVERRARRGELDAWRSLRVIGGADNSLLAFGATYHCPPKPECGAQVRQLATEMIDASNPVLASPLMQARHDAVLMVRLTALRRFGAAIPKTKSCVALVEAMHDLNEPVIFRLEATSQLDPRCTEPEGISTILAADVDPLGDPTAVTTWHQPARALEALARFDAEAARKIITDVAFTYPIWQARAAAARAAVTLKDEALLLRFADDREANVRTVAVAGLAAQASAETTTVALKSLASPDYQLVRTAAESLKKRPPAKDEIRPLLTAFQRITVEGKDTSHDPRASILGRLKMLADQREAGGDSWLLSNVDADLMPVLKDLDPDIASLAAGVIGTVTGTAPSPQPTRRAVEQPSERELTRQPKRAVVKLDNNDEFEMTFLTTEAPIACVRFAKLAQQHYYDNLTFHRIEPLFVVQGGSPGANEYMGAPRFFRDEIGVEHHTVGSVGLSTRGRDTGDGQIFIDLTDQYRLDYTYTVFARVMNMTQVERMLEGAKIVSVHVYY
jgi:cyclophilin family peptidyl-prolyl cis-trans isomerase/HEAT repeat protein